MFELTRNEIEKLIRILDWVMIATLDSEEEKNRVQNIRDKLTSVIKSQPEKDRVKMLLSDEAN